MKNNFFIILFSLCLLGAHAQMERDAFPVQTTVAEGVLEGQYDVRSGLQTYFGIPYALPPVGELRWKAPQPPASWVGVKHAKAFGPRAVQAMVFGDMRFRSNGISEDCLYLNVWTPAKRNSNGLPVLVYFYGGGFVAGDGSEPRYDGASMAKKGIVVVTVNYRLNIFGFFAHPELSKEAPYKASGNYGLLDQSAALQWVQKNIRAFGGDPARVTIAGESAGSASVSAQMASPLSKNLIAGAIGESGAVVSPTMGPVPLVEGEKIGADFAAKVGFTSLAQLRKLSTRELYEIFIDAKSPRFPIVIDGYFFPKTLPEIFNAREQAQVPLLLGWNSSEIPGAAFMQGTALTTENFRNKIKDAYPKNADEVIKLYPHNTQTELEWSAMNLASDRFIVYSTWKWFDLHRKNSNQPVYRYLYSRKRPPLVDQTLVPGLAGGTVKASGPPPPQPLGAQHACEIEYCMGNLNLCTEYAWTPDDYVVSQSMQSYFANFIINGNPNGANLSEWPAASPQDPKPPVMIIDVKSASVPASDDQRFLFHDRFYLSAKP